MKTNTVTVLVANLAVAIIGVLMTADWASLGVHNPQEVGIILLILGGLNTVAHGITGSDGIKVPMINPKQPLSNH